MPMHDIPGHYRDVSVKDWLPLVLAVLLLGAIFVPLGMYVGKLRQEPAHSLEEEKDVADDS